MRFQAITLFCCLISACQNTAVEYKYPEKVKGRYEMPSEKTEAEKNDTVFNKEYLTFRLNEKEEKQVNGKAEKQVKKTQPVVKSEISQEKLWTSMLQVLSQYPILIVQKDQIVVTDWFTDPEKTDRQLKINALKTGTDLKITVLCRKKDENGTWINQKNDATLADKIKNDIVRQSINH